MPGSVHLYAFESGQVRRGFGGQAAFCTAFSVDGRTLAMSGDDHAVCLWDVAAAVEKRRFIGHRDRVTTLAFAPDGTALTSGSADTTALIWNVGR
jgi:WD40 repeat protein